ncbi:transposable element Tcb2 transposase [Trichonephila clavipes]|nr:transposable element Tcb2 transposase [Trichonephila clavipes]
MRLVKHSAPEEDIVVKPMGSMELNSRCQIVLIVMKSHRNFECKLLMVYQDYLMKFAQLRPSETKTSILWSRRPGQGRRRATTPNEDRYLVLTARRHRNMNASLLQQHFRSATGTTVSTQTV